MRFFLLILIMYVFTSVNSQTKTILKPHSSQLKTLKDFSAAPITLPSFDLQKVIEEEHTNRVNKTGMYMFGYEHQTNIDFFSSATWYHLKTEGKIAQLKIKSEGALSMNLIFGDFYLSEHAYIHIFDSERTTIIGAYTNRNNNLNNVLGTDLVKGEEIIIEYYEPEEPLKQSRLLINTVVHGYEDINDWHSQLKVNESGSCNLDVICSDGIPWSKEIRAVARITNGGGLCSGSLVNNTANDGKPYFLTANHCSPQSMASAVFRFNYNSPICGSQNTANSQNATYNHTINGSSFKARNANSDFGLVELNSTPPTNYNVYYSGWNNSGDVAVKTVGIHHPSGDVKKISFDEDSPSSSNFGTSINNGEWRIHQWDRNTTTEGGSSGSGLWDENHLIIGQLHGGAANCANSVNDYYGKFSVSWDGTSSTNRLRDWLDPQNSGTTTLTGFDPNASQYDVNLIAILSPDSTNCGNNVSPKILIRNDGIDALTSITFKYGTNGNIGSSFNWSGNLQGGDTTTIILPSTGVLPQGTNSLMVTATNPNSSTDGNQSNNSQQVNFTNNQDCLAYPNPFRDQLTINFEIEKANNKPVEIFITDIQGKLIWSTTHNTAASSELKINTSQIAKGTYLLKINYEKENTVQKLIKG